MNRRAFLKAAPAVLGSAGEPLHVREITARALSQWLRKCPALQPA